MIVRRLLSWRVNKDVAGEGADRQASVADYLQRVDVFRDLSREEIQALFEGVMLRECAPGTVFFTPDQPSERLFVLKEGQVELYRLTPNGKRLATRRIGPGAIFGEMGLLGQTLHGCFAEATRQTLVCVATREDVLRLLRQRPDVTLRLLEALGNRLKMLEERLEHAAFSPVKVRLSSFLLSNMDESGTVSGYTQAEIGDTIGALRQTVTETLSDFQSKELVEVGHKRIRVTDTKKLEELVQKEQGLPTLNASE
ncbi:MAG: Crp/Fnr family transcriptional regulator [Chloroflexi bacterium]|nr:Crp/Fnr family transcriptional regulator [Chloroflexota bacterium]